MQQMIPLVIGAVLTATILPSVLALLRYRVHPRRIASACLDVGFTLLIAALVLDLSGVLGLAWWALLLVTTLGALWACRSALRPAIGGDGGRRDGADAGVAGEDSASSAAEGSPTQASQRTRDRASRWASPPPLWEVGIRALLFTALAALALAAG